MKKFNAVFREAMKSNVKCSRLKERCSNSKVIKEDSADLIHFDLNDDTYKNMDYKQDTDLTGDIDTKNKVIGVYAPHWDYNDDLKKMFRRDWDNDYLLQGFREILDINNIKYNDFITPAQPDSETFHGYDFMLYYK